MALIRAFVGAQSRPFHNHNEANHLNIAQARAALVAATGLALASVSAGAQQSPDPYTSNSFNDRTVWITIYDLGKTRQLDYGCVNAAGTRKWGSGGYPVGSFYYIRAEVMDDDGCNGANGFGTTVQLNPPAQLTRHDVFRIV